MIQDIAPHTYDPVFRRKKPEDRDYLLHYEYNKVMLLKSGRGSLLLCDGYESAGIRRILYGASDCVPEF